MVELSVADRAETVATRHPPRSAPLQRLFARILESSPFSPTAREILRLANRSTGSLDELTRLIQTDPALVALLLRRLNSAYYRLDRPVQDLHVAARLLGFREFRNLAITVYMSRMVESATEVGPFHTAVLWNHSVAVAAASHLVSRVCGCGVPGDAYIAGLLHDLGLLLAHRQLRRRFAQVVQRATASTALTDVERAVYGFDHAQLGGFAAQRWEFPPAIVDAIQYHHDIQAAPAPHRELVFVVTAADYLCSRAGWSAVGVHSVPLPPDVVYRVLGLDQIALAVIWDELFPTLEKARSLATV